MKLYVCLDPLGRPRKLANGKEIIKKQVKQVQNLIAYENQFWFFLLRNKDAAEKKVIIIRRFFFKKPFDFSQ